MLATVVLLDGRDANDVLLRAVVSRFGGRVWSSAGKGVVATFDAPSRAIRCLQHAHSLGLELRAGMHAGQIDVGPDGIAGVAVDIAAQVLHAAPDDVVLVSRTIAEMVAGSGFELVGEGACGDLGLFLVR